jgi:hypothetical protein
MVWLTETELLDGMIRVARGRVPAFNDWWRDESALEAWWRDNGISRAVRGPCVPVACGEGFVAWFQINLYDETGKPWFDLVVISPDLGYEIMPDRLALKTLLCGSSRYWPDDCIKWTAAKNAAKIPNVVSVVGERVACMTEDGVRIGYAVQVDARGWVERVNVGGAGEMPAQAVGAKWWPVRGRDEAFDMFWARGDFLYKSYMSLVYLLMHAQRRIDKAKGVVSLTFKQREKLAAEGAKAAAQKALDAADPAYDPWRAEEIKKRCAGQSGPFRMGYLAYVNKMGRHEYRNDFPGSPECDERERGWDAAERDTMAFDLI